MPTLYEKAYGCLAAGTIGCAMGVPTEGMSHKQIMEEYGVVKTLLPSKQEERHSKQTFGPDFHVKKLERIPGMGEDGLERHRLACTAIIEKGGRITARDLARIWVRDINPENFGYHLGPQDQIIYYLLRMNFPPTEVGRYAAWPGKIGTSKMMLPIGIVNACNPDQAGQDAVEVGQIKDVKQGPNNYALEVAAAVAAAVAEALKPSATVSSVTNAVLSCLSEPPRKEVEFGLRLAEEYGDVTKARVPLNEKYAGRPQFAPEVLTDAVTTFNIVQGDPKEAILGSVNFGRDTDCQAYIAAGISGALKGPQTIPKEWIMTVNRAIKADPYTVAKRTLEEDAEGLYKALKKNIAKSKQQVELVEAQEQ